MGFVAAQKGFKVTMWHRNSAVVEYIKKTRVHYLVPELHFPENVLFTTDAEKTVNSADIIVIAIPSQSIRSVMEDLVPTFNKNKIIVNVSKGIEINTLMTVSEIITDAVSYTHLTLPTICSV